MADDTSTTTDATEKVADDITTTGQDGAKPELPPEVKRALNKANKEAEQLRLKLKEFEDRDKTEQQKLAEAHQSAEQRAVAAELRALRLEVAADKGLTAGQAKRLVGATREELEADAEDIQREFPATTKPVPLRPDPSQGSRGGAPTSGREAGLAEAQRRFGTKTTTT